MAKPIRAPIIVTLSLELKPSATETAGDVEATPEDIEVLMVVGDPEPGTVDINVVPPDSEEPEA